jgi:transcription elongation factor GreB|tara:strand:- start:310 stop:813 length:504 start_codon:yes stop_codon:yes gene_type:complete
MSRAFIKENDLEHPGIDIPEKVVSPEINYVTPNGLQMLENKSAQLESDRAQLIGDDTQSSKQKKMRLEREIRYYFSRIDSAIVIYPYHQLSNTVLFSARVDVEDSKNNRHTFEIVGEDEADIKLKKISYTSPLAKALIGAKLDDEVIWEKPLGDEYLIINKITYPKI